MPCKAREYWSRNRRNIFRYVYKTFAARHDNWNFVKMRVWFRPQCNFYALLVYRRKWTARMIGSISWQSYQFHVLQGAHASWLVPFEGAKATRLNLSLEREREKTFPLCLILSLEKKSYPLRKWWSWGLKIEEMEDEFSTTEKNPYIFKTCALKIKITVLRLSVTRIWTIIDKLGELD